MATQRDGLARRRATMGYTQESWLTPGIDRPTVGRWKRGTMTPLPWNQPALARALNISLDTLEELLAEVRNAASDDADRVSHALRTPTGRPADRVWHAARWRW